MSFTLDGVTIETQPATMVRLACQSAAILSGHSVGVGDFVNCDDCTREAHGPDAEQAVTCQVTDIVRTEIVPTVHL